MTDCDRREVAQIKAGWAVPIQEEGLMSFAMKGVESIRSTCRHVIGYQHSKIMPGCYLFENSGSLNHEAVALEGGPPSQHRGNGASNGVNDD